jgi:hypothetical protein
VCIIDKVRALAKRPSSKAKDFFGVLQGISDSRCAPYARRFVAAVAPYHKFCIAPELLQVWARVAAAPLRDFSVFDSPQSSKHGAQIRLIQ